MAQKNIVIIGYVLIVCYFRVCADCELVLEFLG